MWKQQGNVEEITRSKDLAILLASHATDHRSNTGDLFTVVELRLSEASGRKGVRSGSRLDPDRGAEPGLKVLYTASGLSTPSLADDLPETSPGLPPCASMHLRKRKSTSAKPITAMI
eukprot:scaffold7052_cov254-Pinguiococcus_pyrenoidosus.AAC.30